ncbi:hypothetical protein KJ885_03195 [Patescibacteria group bacterium]|nr:hypothetical protein [Patescibacteria group bacterium]
MTRNTGIRGFWGNYISAGLGIGCFLVVVGSGLGALIFHLDRRAQIRGRDLYFALEGKSVDNSNAKEAAVLIRTMVKKEKTLSPQEYASVLNKIDTCGYMKLFLAKSNKIIELAQGKIKNLSGSVKITGWMIFLKWFAILSYLCLVLCTTVNFVLVSLDSWQSARYTESLLEWPWREWWTYPSILLMSPALLPCMIVEAGIRVFRGTLRQGLTGRRPEDGQVSVLSEKEIARAKTGAQKKIQAVKKAVEHTKEAWVQNYLANLEQEPQRLEREADDQRQRLSSLGGQISGTQKALAQAQKKLADWKKNEDKIRAKARVEHLKDFERLQKLAHVEAIEMDGDMLCVYTDTIYIAVGRKKYEIGNFKIEINIRQGCWRSLENLCTTHPRGAYHPYGANGSFCFGSLSGPLHMALQEREFAAGVQFILQALQSADGDNPEKVREWKAV